MSALRSDDNNRSNNRSSNMRLDDANHAFRTLLARRQAANEPIRIRIYRQDVRDHLDNLRAGARWAVENPDGSRPGATTDRVFVWTVPSREILVYSAEPMILGWLHEPRAGDYVEVLP